MRANVSWISGALFAGEAGSGHRVLMDGPNEGCGRNLGARPMEMMLLGLGGCTSYDVVDILRKGRHGVTGCDTTIEADRAESPPAVFTRIHIHFVVYGSDLPERAVQRAVDLTAEKYCSASIMLARAGVEITHDFELREPLEEHLYEDELE